MVGRANAEGAAEEKLPRATGFRGAEAIVGLGTPCSIIKQAVHTVLVPTV